MKVIRNFLAVLCATIIIPSLLFAQERDPLVDRVPPGSEKTDEDSEDTVLEYREVRINDPCSPDEHRYALLSLRRGDELDMYTTVTYVDMCTWNIYLAKEPTYNESMASITFSPDLTLQYEEPRSGVDERVQRLLRQSRFSVGVIALDSKVSDDLSYASAADDQWILAPTLTMAIGDVWNRKVSLTGVMPLGLGESVDKVRAGIISFNVFPDSDVNRGRRDVGPRKESALPRYLDTIDIESICSENSPIGSRGVVAYENKEDDEGFSKAVLTVVSFCDQKVYTAEQYAELEDFRSINSSDAGYFTWVDEAPRAPEWGFLRRIVVDVGFMKRPVTWVSAHVIGEPLVSEEEPDADPVYGFVSHSTTSKALLVGLRFRYNWGSFGGYKLVPVNMDLPSSEVTGEQFKVGGWGVSASVSDEFLMKIFRR